MQSRQIDDEQLILIAKEGNAEAFGDLYERHAEVIFRYFYAHVDNRLDAEDLTEDVFMRVWKALPRYDQRGLPFSAFLFRVARNSLIDYYRQRKQVSPIEDLDIYADQVGTEDDMNNLYSRDELRKALSGIKEDYRNVIIHRFLAGLSAEETAQRMQRSIGAIRVLQHRALQALKDTLERSNGR